MQQSIQLNASKLTQTIYTLIYESINLHHFYFLTFLKYHSNIFHRGFCHPLSRWLGQTNSVVDSVRKVETRGVLWASRVSVMELDEKKIFLGLASGVSDQKQNLGAWVSDQNHGTQWCCFFCEMDWLCSYLIWPSPFFVLAEKTVRNWPDSVPGSFWYSTL